MFTVIKQELMLRLRQGATWGQFLFILFVAAAVMSSQRGVQFAAGFCLIAGPIVAAIAGTGILRDFELRVHEFFFTSRLKAWQYFFGRYLGSFILTGVLFLALPLGFWIGTVIPGDSTHLGPFRLAPYAFSYFVFLLPNLLLTSALFFVAGALTRNLFAVYSMGVGLFVLYLIGAGLATAIGSRGAAAILDPYGMALLTTETRYWSPAQTNTSLPSLDGLLLLNRALWSGIGLGVVALGGLLFRFRALAPQLPRRSAGDRTPPPQGVVPKPHAQPQAWRSFLHLVRFHTRFILCAWPYWLFLAFGLIAFAMLASKEEGFTGTPLLPTNSHVLKEVSDMYGALFVFVAAIYAGELCWQDRILRVAPIVEALPLSRTAALLARFVALQFSLILAGIFYSVIGMLQQRAGGVAPEGSAYLMGIFGITGVSLFSFSALAFLVHNRVPNKFVGHLVVVLIVLVPTAFTALGWEHPLLDLGTLGDAYYSDLDGFSAYQTQLLGMGAHWLLVAFWMLALALPKRPQNRGGVALLTVLCALSTGLLLYNFHGIHRFQNENSQSQARADYERTYRAKWLELPQPKMTAADLDVTLWPERRTFRISGRYTLKNKSDKPIPELLLSYDNELDPQKITFGAPATRIQEDTRLGMQVWKLATPLAPGQTMTLDFTVAWDKPGFAARGPRTDIAANGSFLSNLAPRIGYQSVMELTDAAERKKQNLGAWKELPERIGCYQTYIGGDSDWVQLAMTVRTAPDQLALAPGRLTREWQENGRRCFRYESNHVVRYFWAVVSGKYATQKTTYKGTPITVYYHAGHPWNVKRMLSGAKDALAFCSQTYAPYPFSELRIVEFPARGASIAAQAFAGTIPFSEAGGFTLSVGKDDFDTPFYVTAHEVAHQWWAHQLTGANLPGSEVLSESLAEYTALRVAVEAGNEAGEVNKRAADAYLKGRGQDRTEEQPLISTRRQPYICYQKGGLAFHELHWLAGEHFDKVLSSYLKVLAFKEPPYPTAANLVENLKVNLPAHKTRITELFEKITLCDLKVVSVKKKQLSKKRWRTEVVVTAKKVFSDGQGNETPAPLHDIVFATLWTGEDAVTLRATLQQPRQTLVFETEFSPRHITVDPAYHLLDREHDDNTHSVE
ncbi:MAG: hypothetical protein NTX57_17215 [Armatimonadetes bacterium]|nr:hypothetical protein [Armatimonadota bacterium]